MKYRVYFLGTPWNESFLKDCLSRFPQIELSYFNPSIHITENSLFLYFANSEQDREIDSVLMSLLQNCVKNGCIMPITECPEVFTFNVPPILQTINGFFLKKQDDSVGILRLRNYIAAYLGLVQNTRKIFISYRRCDLEVLAHQLYLELVKRKYHPFLDAYSIEEGVDFQEHLRHELVDSDLVLLLDSPSFNSSPYCMEEFDIANQERIPVLDIRFNISPRSNLHRFCSYWETGYSCEYASENTHLIIPHVLNLMEEAMVDAYLFKQKHILDELSAREHVEVSVRHEGMPFASCDDQQICYIPITHIPTSSDMYKTFATFSALPVYQDYSLKIIYNGSYCRPDYASHLSWLDSYLPVKLINITQ